ncbi:MAG: TonB-dependent receptor, partial [Acidobacteria bacterium]|nr:TonB-dependent receptor [Acidobacteriota bacterium]
MQTRKQRILSMACLSALLGFAGFFSQPIHAQIETTGQIQGTVLDAQGAIMPQVEVSFRHELTGQEFAVRSNEAGQYRARGLALGRYSMTASATGFKQFNSSGIEVSANQVVRVDIQMQIGEITESVTVSAKGSSVNITTSALDSLVDSKLINDLPLNGRNILALLTLSPGVTGARLANAVSFDQQRINANGNRSYSTNVMLDGATLYYAHRGQALMNPPPDAVQEVKVITSGVGAEFSRGSVAVSSVTKSGTNELHGALWEFFRNDALDARSFFATNVPKLRYNQFGAAVGGPIVRNKAFFFGSYEGLEERSDVLMSSAFPPTQAERSGDFSNTRGNLPRDPETGQPFPNGRIPVSRFDSVAQKLLARFPLPNQADGRYIKQVSRPVHNRTVLGKVDYHFGPGDRTAARYFISDPSSSNPFGRGNIDGYGGNVTRNRGQNFTASHSHAFSSRLLLNARFGFTRFFYSEVPESDETLADFGAKWPLPPPPSPSPGPPQINIAGRMNAFSAQRGIRLGRTHEGGGDLSWLSGKHEIKFGGLLQRIEQNWIGTNRALGQFTFNGTFTRNEMADFLLGSAASLVHTGPLVSISHYYSYGFYLQDNWRASRRLTLNLGLRWEVYEPWRERDGNNVAFVPGVRSRFLPTAPLGLAYDRDPEFPFQRDAVNPGPRFGFAYDVFGQGKTSIRGGYTLSYDPLTAHQGAAFAAPPLVIIADTTNVGPLVDPRRFEPVDFTQPKGTFQFPVRIEEISFVGALRTPYMQNMNLTLEQQVAPETVVRASYVASLGRKLPITVQANPAVYIPGQSDTRNTDQRRIHSPIFGSIISNENGANADYHSFQLEAIKRYASGFLFSVAYAYAKGIDEVTTSEVVNGALTSNVFSRRLDRGLGDFDIRQRLVASWLWELPLFRQSKSVPGRLLGGWQFGGIATLQDGSPFTVVSGVDRSLQGINRDRPDLLGDPRLPTGRPRSELISSYFDTGKFRLNAEGQFGSAGRSILIGPGTANFDLSLHKAIAFSESRRLVLRWE